MAVCLDLAFALYAVWPGAMTAPKPLNPKKQEIAMPQANSSDIMFYWLIGIVAALFLFLLLIGFVSFLNGFSRQLKYINCEIRRTEGLEHRYWIRKRRRLWLSLIPFIKF